MFSRDDLDLGERQLGFALAFDCDLDNFAAAIGFSKAITMALASEDGMLTFGFSTDRKLAEDITFLDLVIEYGTSSLEEAVYDPVQRILNQVRMVKASSMYVYPEYCAL